MNFIKNLVRSLNINEKGPTPDQWPVFLEKVEFELDRCKEEVKNTQHSLENTALEMNQKYNHIEGLVKQTHIQNRVLESLLGDTPQEKLLIDLVLEIENHLGTGLCALFIADSLNETLEISAAPNLSDQYRELHRQFSIGPTGPLAGQALFLKQNLHKVHGDMKDSILEMGYAHSYAYPICHTLQSSLDTAAIAVLCVHTKTELNSSQNEFLESVTRVIQVIFRHCEVKKNLELEKLSRLNRSKMATLGEMAGGVAHEINTPLAAILMKMEALEDHYMESNLDPETFAEASEFIKTTVLRISRIIKGLRSFARNASDDPMIPSTLKNIVDDTLNLCDESLKHNEVDIEIDYGGCEGQTIECRPTEVAQVLLNLINNSMDAISGLKKKWIRIKVSARDEGLEISFTDAGKGIPDEIIDKLLQPFFTTKEPGKGTGLGLSISRGIILSHQGEFYLDRSSPNTQFIIQLPFKQKIRQVA